MDEQQSPVDDLLRQAVLDQYLGGQPKRGEGAALQRQPIPVNVYQTDEDVVVVAPMPGVEWDNIEIELLGSTLTLSASLRGPGQANRQYFMHEWTYGSYYRSITLPVGVDAAHANASHDNGVLVVSLPKVGAAKSVQVSIRPSRSTDGSRRGHAGHHTTREGLQDKGIEDGT